MKFGKRFFVLTVLLLSFSACHDNRLDVDISHVNVSFNVINVDSLFRNTPISELDKLHDRLTMSIGEAYLYEVAMNVQQPKDQINGAFIHDFYFSEYINALEDEKEKLPIYEQLSMVKKGFSYLFYHFPEINLPKQVVLINKLFSGIQCTDNLITIGLEKYLDPSLTIIKGIPNDQLYQWQKENMNSLFLARDIVLRWIQHTLFQEKDEHLAYHLVQAGKVLYFLQAAFPDKDEAFIMRYNVDEIDWARKNESLFWEYLVREEMLFKNNVRDKTNFLNEGPYTVGLPEQGPDRLGQFLGLRMVKQYMKQNKELSLPELLTVEYNTILQSYEID